MKTGFTELKQDLEKVLLTESDAKRVGGTGMHDPEMKRLAYTAKWLPEIQHRTDLASTAP